MDAITISQIANPFIQTIFILVMGLVYYFTIRNLRSQVQETSQARFTGGRPLIIVTEDYENLPTINLIVQNVGFGPAKNITFEFSSQVESSDGFVLSDLAFFQERITSLRAGWQDRLLLGRAWEPPTDVPGRRPTRTGHHGHG